jgi:hypothetical protein
MAPDAPLNAHALEPEDSKLFTLARAAAARITSPAGAAVRDETGRSYTGAAITLGQFEISAVALAVVTAATSGATGLEAVVSVGSLDSNDLDLVRALGGSGVSVFEISASGVVVARHES